MRTQLVLAGGLMLAALGLTQGCQKALSEAPYYTDFDKALAAAADQGKPLLVKFQADW